MGLERGRGLCKRRQLVVLSEREKRASPDTVDKHLSLRLFENRACKRPARCPGTARGVDGDAPHPPPPPPPLHPQSSLPILGWGNGNAAPPPLPTQHTARRAGQRSHTHTRARVYYLTVSAATLCFFFGMLARGKKPHKPHTVIRKYLSWLLS